MIPDGNCAEPLIVPLGKFANTFAASVTSAEASIASNLFFNVVVKSFAVWAGRDVSKEPSPTKEPVNEPVNGRVSVLN